MAAAPYPLPGGLKSLFVGRVLYKEVDGNRVRGETHSYNEFFQDGPNSVSKSYWVQWENGERMVMPLADVEQCATEEFVTSSWMPPEITEWQKAGWDVSRVEQEHVRCSVLSFQKAMGTPINALKSAMEGATPAASPSSGRPLQLPLEVEQAAEPAEPELDMGVDMDVEDEQGGTIGPGRGNMSETARDAGEHRRYAPSLRDFDAHGDGNFWRQQATVAFEKDIAAEAARRAASPGRARQAMPPQGPAAGEPSPVQGNSATSGASTPPDAAAAPGQGDAAIVWRARLSLALSPRGGQGGDAREAAHQPPGAGQAGAPMVAAAARAAEGAGQAAAGRAPALAEAIPEWPSEGAGGASAPYTQRTFSRRCKYPDKFCMALGDMPAKEWVEKEKTGDLPPGEYVVSEILDERWDAGEERREFIVKWQGFELHPDQWIGIDDLDDCAALDAWESRHPPAGPPRKRARKRPAEATPATEPARRVTRPRVDASSPKTEPARRLTRHRPEASPLATEPTRRLTRGRA